MLDEPLAQESLAARWRAGLRLAQMLAGTGSGFLGTQISLALVEALLPLALLWTLRHLVDAGARALHGGDLRRVMAWSIGFGLAACAQGAAGALGRLAQDRARDQLAARVQEQVLAKAQALPLAAFEEPECYNQLQRIEQHVEGRLPGTFTSMLRIAGRGLRLAALLLYVAAAGPLLPLLLAAGSAIFAFVRIRTMRRRFLLDRVHTEPERRLHYYAELMCGREAAAEVRLFDFGPYMLGSWSARYRDLRDQRLAHAAQEGAHEAASSVGQSLTFGAALALIAARVAGGALTLGQYAAFAGAVQQFQAELFNLFWEVATIDNSLLYVLDFFAYLDRPEDCGFRIADCGFPASVSLRDDSMDRGAAAPCSANPQSAIATSAVAQVTGPQFESIVFENVTFRYPGSEAPALSELSFTLGAGERLAVVGENGAGKSTLARLLLGLYRPTSGRILVDGVDLTSFDPAAWRARCAAVFQDFQQYRATARENIAFGNVVLAGDDEAVRRAAQLAGASALMEELPRGDATPLGKEFDQGIDLSLGEWQKFAVARAYLRDAQVLVLDEPTAALDARAEVEIYRRFRDAAEGRTVLLISHRLGSARLADRILVLERGRVVEEGAHQELLQRGGLYATMLRTQAAWYA